MEREDSPEPLRGGNMNLPLKRGNLVYKDAHGASETIHRLLCHVRGRGLSWLPESYGIREGKHILSYIRGEVPADTPDWLWTGELLREGARRLRQWHDATEDFSLEGATWLLENDEPREVVCHSDFAPYNIVFRDHEFEGLIDFDLCCPGSRLWDISYALYRFVPLLPESDLGRGFETSPLPGEGKIQRMKDFLNAYGGGEQKYLYDIPEALAKVQKRLTALSEWSLAYGKERNNEEILHHAAMYSAHANWVINLTTNH